MVAEGFHGNRGLVPRVGDDGVQPSQSGDAGIDRGGHGVHVTDIGQPRRTPPAPLLDLPCQVAQLVRGRRRVERYHIGTLVGEPRAVRPTGAASGAGDHHHLAE